MLALLALMLAGGANTPSGLFYELEVVSEAIVGVLAPHGQERGTMPKI